VVFGSGRNHASVFVHDQGTGPAGTDIDSEKRDISSFVSQARDVPIVQASYTDVPMRPIRIHYAKVSRVAPPVSSAVLLFISLLGCAVTGFATQKDTAEKINTQGMSSVPSSLGAPLARDPIFVYNNWSAYDELSDNIPLTEHLAMKELDEILRFRDFGVRFDYYMMDAFWFDPDGGYRTWRRPNWPNGPEAWIKRCRDNGILPGLWFGTNGLVKLNPLPAWQDSLTEKKESMSLSEGGFLPNFMDTLQYWYDHGIRMFEFDFADFDAATPATAKTKSREEIHTRNVDAFRGALKNFRQRNRDIVLVAFNGFGGDLESTAGPFPFHNAIDLRWLEVFDSLYAGDPRASDVPEMNFWRSMDIYSDHMVRRFEQSFMPLERIDATSFMLGNTGTNYYRKTHAWKGELILMMARGGWVNTVHGNLEFLTDEDARWFAKVQALYLRLESLGRTKTFGGIPGEIQPYGFGSLDREGAVYVVVNPAQSVEEIQMPRLSQVQKANANGRLLFRDAGFLPVVTGDKIKLGPGQMAVVGYGRYTSPEYDVGIQADVQIPRSIRPLDANFSTTEKNMIEATIVAPARGDLRIIFQQNGIDGNIRRSWPGGPPTGVSVGKVLTLHVSQGGKDIPVEIDYDRVIWSGLSWGVGEVRHGSFSPARPLTIRCASAEHDAVILVGRVYEVEY
jgi:hypothetical protein